MHSGVQILEGNARVLLGRRRDFMHAEAKLSCEAVWEDIRRRSIIPDTAHNKTFSFQAQFFHAQVAALG